MVALLIMKVAYIALAMSATQFCDILFLTCTFLRRILGAW